MRRNWKEMEPTRKKKQGPPKYYIYHKKKESSSINGTEDAWP